MIFFLNEVKLRKFSLCDSLARQTNVVNFENIRQKNTRFLDKVNLPIDISSGFRAIITS